MSSWAFYNAVRDAMRRMADADRDKPKAIGNYVVGEPEADDDVGQWRSDMLAGVDPPEDQR